MTEDPSPPPHPGPSFPPRDGTDQPPPLTAYAWRTGLVRPTQGRLLAGVCGAIGRATNTDPILWRVLLSVLAIFGGIGVIVYLLGWLLLPADGDTASPVEAVLGRGRSATSAVLTVIAGIILLGSFPVLVSEPFRPGPWAVILIGGALLLLLRDRRRSGSTSPPVAPSPAAPTYAAPNPGVPMSTATSSPAGTPPFAPYGPFAPPPPPPGYAPPVAPPPPPRRKRERSRLAGLTFSVILVVVGVLGVLSLTGYSIPAAAYFAAALATVGLGLVVGAWFGRGRGLIALGFLLAFLTAGAATVHSVHHNFGVGEQTWVVTNFDQLKPSYEQQLGDATLDLSGLNFAGRTDTVDLDVHVNAGNLQVIVPANVDVVVDADVNVGNADVFDQSWGGLNPGKHTVTDLGDDGAGGGQLHIHASVDAGNLEVTR